MSAIDYILIILVLASLYLNWHLVQVCRSAMKARKKALRDAQRLLKRGEEAQEQAIVDKRRFLEALGEAFLLIGPAGHIVLANTLAKELFQEERLEGRKVGALVCNQELLGHVQEAFDTDGPVTKEFTLSAANSPGGVQNGITAWHLDSAITDTPIKEKRILLRNVTQNYLTNQMRRDFVANASHELRTPLTSIRGWVETLRTLDDPSDENYRKGLEIINNETARLYNMVEELLDFSRLQNGRLKMTCRPLDLVAELTDAVLFCEARIQREGLVLVYNEPEEMIPVYADPDRLRQVFINILDNAIKYSAPGGRITVKLWAGEYKAFIEFIDQGRGIPPEDLENVKTKFYKGSNSVRGSGIGLALVDSIMTALDGTMDIKSTLGRGTVVTLGLPLYKK